MQPGRALRVARATSVRAVVAPPTCYHQSLLLSGSRLEAGREWFEGLQDHFLLALMESVDGWPLAMLPVQTFGGQSQSVTAVRRDGLLIPSARGLYAALGSRFA